MLDKTDVVNIIALIGAAQIKGAEATVVHGLYGKLNALLATFDVPESENEKKN